MNMVTFVGENYVRKPPMFERFIQPKYLQFKNAHVTHPDLKLTFNLKIVSVRNSILGIIAKGTIIEVNVAELGLVTPSGKGVVTKFAQVTNKPELDYTINAVMIV